MYSSWPRPWQIFARTEGRQAEEDSRTRRTPLEAAPDVLLETVDDRRAGTLVVGFALETGDGRANARGKLRDKKLDLIVLNPADEPGAGFDVDTNRVIVLDPAGGEAEIPLQSKDAVAEALLDRVVALLDARA
jgi:phosphopantothenoylcysteine decarboxylase / phosphopantothenate---cysteine ligase